MSVENRSFIDEYLMGRSLVVEKAARNFMVFAKAEEDLPSLLEDAEVQLWEWWGKTELGEFDNVGVLDLPVHNALSNLFLKSPFYKEGDILSPIVYFPTSYDPDTRIFVPRKVLSSPNSSSREIRGSVSFEITNVHDVLEKRHDIERARTLGLLGGTATTFSITRNE